MNFKTVLTSWKTTASGVILLAAAILGQVALAFDNDPLTNIDWGLLIAEIGAAFGFLSARDYDVSSEDSGLKEETKSLTQKTEANV